MTWYPGHMAKAWRLIKENIKLVDVVVEIRDARIPASSHNPEIKLVCGRIPRLVILNKADLANKESTDLWLESLTAEGTATLAVNSLSEKMSSRVVPAIKKLASKKMKRLASKGRLKRAVRCMVVGIPNVGKSSFINRIIKRRAAKVGSRPGVTRGQQWVKIGKELELLDMPGVLRPEMEDPQKVIKMIIVGVLKEETQDMETSAEWLLTWLRLHYPKAISKRYKIEKLLPDTHGVLEQIGKKRGLLLSGGNVNIYDTCIMLLTEFREGLLGRFTLELPEENVNCRDN